MAAKDDRIFPRSRLRPGAEFRRHRPGGRGARPQGGVPVRPGLRRRLQGLRLRGASGEPLRADAARADGEILGGLHQRPHPEFPQIALRPGRQLREGLLDRDRRQRQMGAEGPARRARPRSSRTSSASTTSSCSRRSSSTASRGCASSPARRTRSRTRTSRRISPAARESDHAGHTALPRPLQRGDRADPCRLQRLPRRERRGALPDRPVLRGLALSSTCCSIPRR